MAKAQCVDSDQTSFEGEGLIRIFIICSFDKQFVNQNLILLNKILTTIKVVKNFCKHLGKGLEFWTLFSFEKRVQNFRA